MPVLKPNHRQILAARAIGGKKTRYRIEGTPGLWLYVSPTGVRTWYARYQLGSGEARIERWYRIGNAATLDLSKAIQRAKAVVNAVDVEERDPHAERKTRRADAMTFAELFEEWYARHAKPKLARAETDRFSYRLHIEPSFAKQKVRDIRRAEIGRFRDAVAKKASPLTSNRVLELISRVFNWALDEGLIEFNPAARLRKVAQRKPRERILTDSAIARFWQALEDMEHMTGEHMGKGEKGRMLSPATRSILRLLLLTAQRRGEVVGARKAELDLDCAEPVWTVSSDRTKNGLLQRVPLCPMAAQEFRKAVAASPPGSPLVFPSAENPLKAPICAESVTRAMARLVDELMIGPLSPHDLRRTVGTQLALLGLPVHVRALVLNHSPQSRGVTDAVYNRYAYDREKRDALEAWERRLQELLRKPASKNNTRRASAARSDMQANASADLPTA